MRRFLPTREQVQGRLRWLGPRLLLRRLWDFRRRGVAIGVALGAFSPQRDGHIGSGGDCP
ncbi:MAG: hypothetical protein ACUVSD_00355 [Thiobacillaceae bacterium]